MDRDGGAPERARPRKGGAIRDRPAGGGGPGGGRFAGRRRAGGGRFGDVAAEAGAAACFDDEDETEPGQFVDFRCPADLQERWRWAVELCRRSAGAPEPVWRCAEYIAADYLAGVPDLSSILARACAADGRSAEHPIAGAGACPRPAASVSSDDVDLFEAVLRGYEDEHGARGAATPAEGMRVVLPETLRDEPADGARALDRKLRALVKLRQGIAWQQGRLLSTFSRLGLHRVFGFLSFARYCRERLGLGIRRARRLIALDRRLLGLPALEEAYRSGLLSWVKADTVARVADETSERDWLRLAGSTTYRRLRDEVTLAEDPSVEAGAGGHHHGRRGRHPSLDATGEPVVESPWARPGKGRAPAGPRVQTCADPAEDAVESCARAPDGDAQTCARPEFRVRYWAPGDVAALWRHALEVCRLSSGRDMDDWECVALMLDSFEETWDVTRDPRWLRRHRIFERDGWRCRVPGCSSRRNLQAHHVLYRSRGGPDDDGNLAVLCAAHHLRGIHAGRLRCHGAAGGFLRWELGVGDGGPPILATVEDLLLTEPGAPDGPAGGAVLP